MIPTPMRMRSGPRIWFICFCRKNDTLGSESTLETTSTPTST